MSNDAATAEKWVSFVASRPYLTGAAPILDHFRAGSISRLCDCGCESFDLTVAPVPTLAPLVPASVGGGCILSLGFYLAEPAESRRTVEIDVFADDRGFLAGIDVSYCSNSAPMPSEVNLVEPPFQIHGVLEATASNYRLERP
jgi:hypothetical protein